MRSVQLAQQLRHHPVELPGIHGFGGCIFIFCKYRWPVLAVHRLVVKSLSQGAPDSTEAEPQPLRALLLDGNREFKTRHFSCMKNARHSVDTPERATIRTRALGDATEIRECGNLPTIKRHGVDRLIARIAALEKHRA